MKFDTAVTRLLGVEIPIVQAPMGWVAQPELVAAVAEAGAIGLVPGSLPMDKVRSDIRRTRELTSRSFGVNLPIAFIKDPAIVEMIISEGVEFVTTSAGSPALYTPLLKSAGLTVFHVVPSLDAARRAVDAGVDGLIVEGVEGAGFKNPSEVGTMVLLPLVANAVGVPVIAAGGICDGASMAAAFALGAQGVQMGTRMMASMEAGVHVNVKLAVVAAREVDTFLINRERRRPVRVLRTATTERFAEGSEEDPMLLLGRISELYDGGDLNASLPQCGSVAGRIDEILPAREIIARTVAEFGEVIEALSRSYISIA